MISDLVYSVSTWGADAGKKELLQDCTGMERGLAGLRAEENSEKRRDRVLSVKKLRWGGSFFKPQCPTHCPFALGNVTAHHLVTI